MGCAECRALHVFRRSVDSLQRIVGVDVDRQRLINSSNRLRPRTSDYLWRRSVPLMVELYHGNLVDCDQRLLSVDAVTLIEVSVFTLLFTTAWCYTSVIYTSFVYVSVWLSQVNVLRLNIGSHKQCHLIAHGLSFSIADEIHMGLPNRGTTYRRIRLEWVTSTKPTLFISETVQGMQQFLLKATWKL